MANTFSDKATLATSNEFINQVKLALIQRSNELLVAAEKFERAELNQANVIFRNAGNDAALTAWLIVITDATVAASAPNIPADADVQTAVNNVLPMLLV